MAYNDEVVFIDVSHWQRDIDWSVAKPKIHFAYLKASEGSAGIDSKFYRNRDECAGLDIPWGAYHFFKPNKDPRKQAEHFYNLISGFTMQPVLDVEVRPVDMTKQAMFNAVSKFIIRFRELSGLSVAIYTSKNFWDNNLPRTDFDNLCWLWAAHWNKYIAEPAVPLDWKNRGSKMWQWSADGNLRGAEFGAQSKSIDVNRYNGGLAQLRRDYPGVDWQPLDQDPAPGDPAVVTIPVYSVVAAGLNVRDRASVTGSVYFTLPNGARVEALEEVEEGSNTWVRCGQRQYCAKAYNGNTFLA